MGNPSERLLFTQEVVVLKQEAHQFVCRHDVELDEFGPRAFVDDEGGELGE